MPTNPEEKEQDWKNNPPRLQTALQSYNNQDSVVLAQKLPHGSLEQNRAPRNKPTHLWSTNIQQRRQEYIIETVSSARDLGKAGQPHANE